MSRWSELHPCVRPQRVLSRTVVSLALLGLLGCDSTGGDAGGNALDVPGRAGTTHRKVVPGLEEVVMMVTFANRSDEPVTLKSIEPIPGKGFGEVGEVVRIEIATRTPPFVVLSAFGTYPPVERRRKRCIIQETFAVDGYVLRPGERVALLVWWRALKRGRFYMDGERVTYEQDGQTYEQVIPFQIGGWVNTRRRQELTGGEARCADFVRVLSGWRPPDSS